MNFSKNKFSAYLIFTRETGNYINQPIEPAEFEEPDEMNEEIVEINIDDLIFAEPKKKRKKVNRKAAIWKCDFEVNGVIILRIWQSFKLGLIRLHKIS